MSTQEGRKLSVATIDSASSDHLTIITEGRRFSLQNDEEWESSYRDSLTASLRGAIATIMRALEQDDSGENTELLTTAEETLQSAVDQISHSNYHPMDELPDEWTRWYDSPVSSRRPSQAVSAHGTTGGEAEASTARSSLGAQSGEPLIQSPGRESITVAGEGLEITVRNSQDASNTELEIRARSGWAAGIATTAMRSAVGTLLSPKNLLARIVRKPKTQAGSSTDTGGWGLGDIVVTTHIQQTTEEATEEAPDWSNPDPFREPAVYDGSQARKPLLPTEGVPPELDDYAPELNTKILSPGGA
jgi:hypothetical protein